MAAIPGMFRPKAALTDAERASGLRMMTWQAMAGSGADGLASGGFLAAFALILGANNVQIGIMTAIPFIVQPMQIFAVILVERLRIRKVFAVTGYFVAYSTWIPVALIPLVIDVPNAGAVSVLLVFVAIRGLANSFVNTSWNSWLRDIVPAEIMGKFFAQRMRLATLMAAIVGLAAAVYIDFWKGAVSEENIVFGYTIAMMFGAVLLGWAAVGFMARMPEPQMPAQEGPRQPIFKTLAAPFKDSNYRQFMLATFMRNFTMYLAIPFFTVYMLVRLEMSLTLVVGLGVISQLSNVVFMRMWGPLVDQFGSKVVQNLAMSLFLLVILGWAFTTMPERYPLTVPLLVILHIFAGVALAGINISSMTLRMKLAPAAQATSYLTGASLAVNMGAGIAPLLGGLFADFFETRSFQISFEWIDPSRTFDFPAVFLTGYDFLFAVAFLIGILTLNLMTTVREEGEADRETVLDELASQTRDNFRVVTSVPGMSVVSHFPYSYLRHMPGLPGLDVAVGVTAYQLASSTRSAVNAASRGTATASEVAQRVGNNVGRFANQVGRIGNRFGLELAIQSTRGAMHAIDEMRLDVQEVTRGAVRGTLGALHARSVDPREACRGAAYGAVQGAGESGADVALAAQHAIDEIRQSAQSYGLSEEEAVAAAIRGALEAAETFGPEMAARVREVLMEKLLNTVLPESPESGDEEAEGESNTQTRA